MTDIGLNGHNDLRHEICRVGRSLYERGYAHAAAGNISAKVPKEFGGGTLITPTDACLGQLDPDNLAWVGNDGVQRSGAKASKTILLHMSIYKAVPEAGCVLHTHSTNLVAASLKGSWKPGIFLPPITPYFVMKVGRVPLIPYRRPGDPAVAKLVTTAIEEQGPIRGVMLERLGPTVWHRSPREALAVLEELEETAKLWVMSDYQAAMLSTKSIEELQQVFGSDWLR